MHNSGQYLFSREPAQAHVLMHCLTDRGEHSREGDDMSVFHAVAHLAKTRVLESFRQLIADQKVTRRSLLLLLLRL